MIVFDLRCADGCAVFEGWFSSGTDFAEQSSRGLVQCPYCGSARIEKAPMAPRVSRFDDTSEVVKGKLAELALLQT